MVRDDIARELFDRLGFDREGRCHYVPELDIPIEIPSDRLAGSMDKVVKHHKCQHLWNEPSRKSC